MKPKGPCCVQKQRPNPEVTKPDPVSTMAAPRDSVHKYYDWFCDKRQPWQSPILTGNESNVLLALQTKLWHWSYRERMASIRGPDTQYSLRTLHRIFQGTWSNAFSKSTKHTWIGLILGTHPLVPFLKRGITSVCQSSHTAPYAHIMLLSINHISPTTSRALRTSKQISSTPRALTFEEFFWPLGNLCPVDMKTHSWVFRSCYLTRRHFGMISGVFKIFLSPIHNVLIWDLILKSAATLCTVLILYCFLLLRCQMVFWNLFVAVWKSSSMALPISFHTQDFASRMGIAALPWPVFLQWPSFSHSTGQPQWRQLIQTPPPTLGLCQNSAEGGSWQEDKGTPRRSILQYSL